MAKILTLYHNELYKIFKSLRVLILMILLVFIALLSAIVPSYSYQYMDDRQLQDPEARFEFQQMTLDNYNYEFGPELMNTPGYEGAILARTAAQAAYESHQTLFEEDPEFSTRFYIPDLLITYHLSAMAMDPAAYEIEDDVAYDDEGKLRFDGLYYEPFDTFSFDGADPELIHRLAEDALESQRVEDYASLKLALGKVRPTDPSMDVHTTSTRKYYEALEATGKISEKELYSAQTIDEKISSITELSKVDHALASGQDLFEMGGGPLIPSRRKILTDQQVLYHYKYDHDIPIVDYYANMGSGHEASIKTNFALGWIVATLALMVFIGIQAGSIVSSELESGSVKLLIIAPVRRWKMYAAKLLALWTSLAILLALMYAAFMVFTYFLRGVGAIQPLIYAYEGRVRSLSFPVRMALESVALFIKLTFYATLVMMLSSLFRRTALTVGMGLSLTLFDYFMTLIYYNTTCPYWAPVVPWVNLDLTARRFSPLIAEVLTTGFGVEWSIERVYQHSLGASGLYIVVFLGLFIWAGMSAFTKRDI